MLRLPMTVGPIGVKQIELESFMHAWPNQIICYFLASQRVRVYYI